MDSVAVYVHIPFCPSKCGYCDFNSFALSGDVVNRTCAATIAEISRSPHRGGSAKTIFFGGGTPTQVPIDDLVAILDAVREAHPPVAGCEITSEANPGTVDAAKFSAMRSAGFNRISLGAQSFRSDELLRLGRVHTSGEIDTAVARAREAGFDNINIDLMFGLPNQRRDGWMANLEHALDLETTHLSLYGLTIEPGTDFYKQQQRGMLDLPDEATQVEMYEQSVRVAASAGFLQYEISNFARPGFECEHNRCYWRGEEYVGYGPGAVERVGNRRWTHVKHPEAYCAAVDAGSSLACAEEALDGAALRLERIMLGLRMNSGIENEPGLFADSQLQGAVDRGLVVLESGWVRLTALGRRFCNQAVLQLA